MLNICGRCKRWLIPFPCLEIQADAHKAYDYTSKGVVRADRTDLNEYKREFATTRDLHCLVEVDARNSPDIYSSLSLLPWLDLSPAMNSNLRWQSAA